MPAPERDLDATRERLRAWLETRLPHACDLTLSELSGPGATGFSSDTLFFDLAWSADGDRWQERLVLRLEPTGFTVFPHYDVARQFSLQRGLWRTDVPVPRMLWLEKDPEALGSRFYVMERIEGRIPPDNPPYHGAGWLTELAPDERAALWWSGLDTLARLHTLDIDEQWRLRFLREQLPVDGRRPIEHALDAWTAQLAWAAEGRPQPTCEAALARLRETLPAGPDPLALCWGDARLGNQVFRDGRCVACLDWEMAELGHPLQDLAWWLFLDRHHSEGCGLPRLAGFPERAESSARWEAATGLSARHLAWHEAWAAFRFGVIMIRVGRQLDHFGLLPQGVDFERNNTVTRLLARMLELPPPGDG